MTQKPTTTEKVATGMAIIGAGWFFIFIILPLMFVLMFVGAAIFGSM
jgi:hypothetical protein